MTKPIYDTGQIITALTTQDGGVSSVAWSTDIITFSISTGQVGAWRPFPAATSSTRAPSGIISAQRQTHSEGATIWE
jgi:hypothetical protein